MDYNSSTVFVTVRCIVQASDFKFANRNFNSPFLKKFASFNGKVLELVIIGCEVLVDMYCTYDPLLAIVTYTTVMMNEAALMWAFPLV